jgi:hypothetical protein
MTEVARFLAYFLLPKDRYCFLGFCLKRDDAAEKTYARGGLYAAFDVMTPYMPQISIPVEILEPADMVTPCGESRCRSSRWQYANLAALVKSVYGRSGVFALAYTADGEVPKVPKRRLIIRPFAQLDARSLRVIMSARISAARQQIRSDCPPRAPAEGEPSQCPSYVFIVNGYKEHARPEEIAMQMVGNPTSIYEVLYIDSKIAVYAASASYLHSLALATGGEE